jgi:hypothetical protein
MPGLYPSQEEKNVATAGISFNVEEQELSW